MTVTTGGRGSASATASAVGVASRASGEVGLASVTTWPISPTTSVAVSRSSTWLIVTMEPTGISVLLSSAALMAARQLFFPPPPPSEVPQPLLLALVRFLYLFGRRRRGFGRRFHHGSRRRDLRRGGELRPRGPE